MSDPKLLLLDEPSLGLAPMVVESLYDVFANLKQTAMTIVLVEQFVEYALGLADEVAALNKGKVVLSGTPADLASDPALHDVYMAGHLSHVRDAPVSSAYSSPVLSAAEALRQTERDERGRR